MLSFRSPENSLIKTQANSQLKLSGNDRKKFNKQLIYSENWESGHYEGK